MYVTPNMGMSPVAPGQPGMVATTAAPVAPGAPDAPAQPQTVMPGGYGMPQPAGLTPHEMMTVQQLMALHAREQQIAALQAAQAQRMAAAAGTLGMQGQMPPAAQQGTLGAIGLQPNPWRAVAKSALTGGALGAALGAGAGMLPIVPGGPITGALLGGVAGSAIGLVRGIVKARRQVQLQQQMMPGMMQPGLDGTLPPADGIGARSTRSRRKRRAATSSAITSPSDARTRRSYTVKSGDTLGGIAQRHGTTWQRLHELNRNVIGNDPAVIRPGMKLKVPAGAKR